MPFPEVRMRRLRRTEALRRLVRETTLSLDDLVMPLFLVPGRGVTNPVPSMPGIAQLSVDRATDECRRLADMGIPAVILFGIPEHKDATGSSAWREDGVVQQAVRAIKREVPDLAIITDVCLCEYTDHGHCGVFVGTDVDNDATLDLLAKAAVSHAQAGADMVAPSDMMDGRVAAIREALDSEGFEHIPILSYAAKFASAFYGPFREAAQSAPKFGDRRTYQMDPANGDEALREVELDLDEGADVVMVKPAMLCLDVLWRVKQTFGCPVAAYQVSGEYTMIQSLVQSGLVDERRAILESLVAIRRAGADFVITYFAAKVAPWLA